MKGRLRTEERLKIREMRKIRERKWLTAGKSRRWMAVAAVLVTGILAAGCAKKSSGAVERIQALGNLRAAIVDTQSRYTKLDGDTPVGIEPDLVQWIADALGVTVQYQVCDKAEALAAVAAGYCSGVYQSFGKLVRRVSGIDGIWERIFLCGDQSRGLCVYHRSS